MVDEIEFNESEICLKARERLLRNMYQIDELIYEYLKYKSKDPS